MGYFIDQLPDGSVLPKLGKAELLLKHVEGSKIIEKPTEFAPDLVCVVDNGPFEAAGYMYDPRELEYVLKSLENDKRPYVWLMVPGAAQLSGYEQKPSTN